MYVLVWPRVTCHPLLLIHVLISIILHMSGHVEKLNLTMIISLTPRYIRSWFLFAHYYLPFGFQLDPPTLNIMREMLKGSLSLYHHVMSGLSKFKQVSIVPSLMIGGEWDLHTIWVIGKMRPSVIGCFEQRKPLLDLPNSRGHHTSLAKLSWLANVQLLIINTHIFLFTDARKMTADYV